MKHRTTTYLLIPVLALCFAACGGGGSGGDDGAPAGDGTRTHEQVLDDLLIDTGLADPDPDDNPLGAGIVALDPTREIFWMNGGPKTKGIAAIHEDRGSARSFFQLFGREGPAADWAETRFKNAIAADIDGDGYEEIVVAYLVEFPASGSSRPTADLRVKVIDRSDGGSGSFVERDELVRAGITLYEFPPENSTSPSQAHLPTMAKGNFDGDDGEEVVIGLWELYLLDLPAGGSQFEVDVKNCGAGTQSEWLGGVFVAAGDVLEGGPDEIVATWSAYCEILDENLSPVIPPVTMADMNLASLSYGSFGNVAVGDIDGVPGNEVVFHGAGFHSGEYRLAVFAAKPTPSGDTLEALPFLAVTETRKPVLPWDGVELPLALLDFDGDGMTEIAAANRLWRYADAPADASGYAIEYGRPTDLPSSHAEMLHGFTIGSSAPTHLAASDVDGDHRDDLVYTTYSQGSAGVNVWSRPNGGTPASRIIHNRSNSWRQPRICLANLDEDSAMVEYTGKCELLFSDIEVLAVLACPPYHAGIGQAGESTGTTIGRRESHQVVSEKSLAVSVGFSVGVKADAMFLPLSAESHVKASIGSRLRSGSLTGKSISVAWSSGPDEDKVVFTAFPFDVYHYRVVDPGSDPDLEKGGLVTVSIPRSPQVQSVSRKFFNENNGDYPDIDGAVLGHTIGDVSSYPKSPRTGGLWSNPVHVGQGSGQNAVTIETTTGATNGNSFDFTVDVESKVQVGSVVLGAYASYQLGYSYEVTNTETTFYQGVVDNIPASVPAGEMGRYWYSWGICAYPITRGNDKFTVVNYWVE